MHDEEAVDPCPYHHLRIEIRVANRGLCHHRFCITIHCTNPPFRLQNVDHTLPLSGITSMANRIVSQVLVRQNDYPIISDKTTQSKAELEATALVRD